MKTLKLDHELAELVRRGSKMTTWRVNDEKDLSVDDEVELIDKVDPADKRTWEIFGVATIDQVASQRLGDLSDDDKLGHEGYASESEMYAALRRYYGKSIGPATPVKIIRFRFKAYAVPRRLLADADYATPITELKLFADGGSRGNPGPSASGYVLLDMDDVVVKKSGVYLGITTNNQAEYIGLKTGLEEALKLRAQKIHVYLDSLLVVNQLNGKFKVRNRDLWPLYEATKALASQFKHFNITHVPREMNKQADAMVNEILDEALGVS